MIDWAATREKFGITKVIYRCKVVVICDICGIQGIKLIERVADAKDGQLEWKCRKCHHKLRPPKVYAPEDREIRSKNSKKAWKDPNYRKQVLNSRAKSQSKTSGALSNKMKELWKDPKYREKWTKSLNTIGCKTKLSNAAKKMWADDSFKNHMVEVLTARGKMQWQDSEYRAKVIASLKGNEKLIRAMRELWATPGYPERMSQLHKNLWKDTGYREKMIKILANQPKCSSLQTTLYSILDDLGIKYYREYSDKAADSETIIGPWEFDCVIPRMGLPSLIIECNGDYWHSLKENVTRDLTKTSYIANNFSGQYEIKTIWGHEFLNKDRVVELIKYWMGISKIEAIDFEFIDTIIKPCTAKDYRLLLSKYHYLSNAGRGGIAYGAYLGDELIAVCVFSPVVRQNINIDGYRQEEVRELSRLCIHPKYQKKNFASWFISKCIKSLDSKYKVIISYCDTTFNHDGTIYKAANFVQDSEVPPDYRYISRDGWVMHKRTLYGYAKLMRSTEAEYAEQMGYTKVYGDKKLRFKFIR